MAQKEIETDCKGAGYSPATIKRAKKRLGVVSTKDSMAGGWFWSLPTKKHEGDHEGDEDAHTNYVNTFGKNDPLQDNSTVWEV
jgi:hypothetical protein